MNPRDKIIKMLLTEYEQELAQLNLAELLHHLQMSRKMSGLSDKEYREIAKTIEKTIGD